MASQGDSELMFMVYSYAGVSQINVLLMYACIMNQYATFSTLLEPHTLTSSTYLKSIKTLDV